MLYKNHSFLNQINIVIVYDIHCTSLGKRVSENYRNLSEFWRQIAEQLFGDRFRDVFGANSTNSTVFVAIYIKSKIFIGLELLISYRNTVTASMKNISVMNDGEDDDEPFRPFPIQCHFIVCKLKCSFIINRQQEQR